MIDPYKFQLNFLAWPLRLNVAYRFFQLRYFPLPQRLSSSGCYVVFRSSFYPFCFDSFSDVVSCYWSSEGLYNASSFSRLQLTNE